MTAKWFIFTSSLSSVRGPREAGFFLGDDWRESEMPDRRQDLVDLRLTRAKRLSQAALLLQPTSPYPRCRTDHRHHSARTHTLLPVSTVKRGSFTLCTVAGTSATPTRSFSPPYVLEISYQPISIASPRRLSDPFNEKNAKQIAHFGRFIVRRIC